MTKFLLLFIPVMMAVSCLVFKVSGQEVSKDIINKIEMVTVQGGSFQMGSDEGTPIEKPIHSVNLGSFQVGKYEVTQALWYVVMESKPSFHKNCMNCPVENVSWFDVQDFVDKLNKMTGKHYRLPTEAEWEFAARGGNASKNYRYSGSDYLDSIGWQRLNSNDSTHTVGKKIPNELGIYDMSGNVLEWVQDWSDGEYYKTSPADNPQGPVNGRTRVAKGGSYVYNSFFCRNTSRHFNFPDIPKRDLGFRLALDIK